MGIIKDLVDPFGDLKNLPRNYRDRDIPTLQSAVRVAKMSKDAEKGTKQTATDLEIGPDYRAGNRKVSEESADFDKAYKQGKEDYITESRGQKPDYEKGTAEKALRAFKMAKGGKVSSASSRGDGIAQRGKTKGRFV